MTDRPRFAKAHVIVLLFATALARGEDYVIVTFAGGAPPPTPALGLNLSIGRPQGVAIAADGSIFFTSLNCVFKQDSNRIVTRIAGTSRPGYFGDGGQATSAQLHMDAEFSFGGTGGGQSPAGVAVDGAGNVFVADIMNHRVRRISPDGIITTVAGDGTLGVSGDGGPATSAQLRYPSDVAVDDGGNLFIADGVVRRVSPDGIITTVAGGGNFGTTCSTCGDGGPATSAQVGASGVAVDRLGNLFIADSNNYRIRKVTPYGIISTVAGRGFPIFGCAPNGDGGPAINAQLCHPSSVAIDSAGSLYFSDTVADFDGDFRQIVRKVSAAGTITTVAGVNCFNFCPPWEGDGALATKATLSGALGLAVDGEGGLLISDPFNYRIRRVSPEGVITSLAGGGSPPFAGDGSSATSTNLLHPTGVAADAAGNVFIADDWSNRIHKVSPDGIITTIVGGGPYGYSGDGPAIGAQLWGPYGLAVDGTGNLFFADGHRVRKLSPDGIITTVAGYGGYGDSGDGGPAIIAALHFPRGLAVDDAGNLFISDNGKIRKVSRDGIINTIAEDPYVGGIAADKDGNLFIAGVVRVQKLSPDGVMTTVAGNGERGFSGDGGLATDARLSYASGVALDSAGAIFIADCLGGSGGCRIRKVSSDGIITTIAGDGTSGSSGDGGPALAASISYPGGLAVDGLGRVYLTDHSRNSGNIVRVLRQVKRD